VGSVGTGRDGRVAKIGQRELLEFPSFEPFTGEHAMLRSLLELLSITEKRKGERLQFISSHRREQRVANRQYARLYSKLARRTLNNLHLPRGQLRRFR